MKKKHWRSSEGQKRSCFSQPSGRYAQLYGGGAPTPNTFPRFLTRNTFPLAQHGTKHTKSFFFVLKGCDWRSSSHIGHSFLIDARAAWPYRWKNGGRWEKNEQKFMIGSYPKTGNECFAAGRTCFSVIVEWHFFHPSSSFTAMLFSDMVDPLFLPKSTAPNLSCSILNLSQTVRSGLAMKKINRRGEKKHVGEKKQKNFQRWVQSHAARPDRRWVGGHIELWLPIELNWTFPNWI